MRVISASQLTIAELLPPEVSPERCRSTARIEIAGIVAELRTDIPKLAHAFHRHYIDHAAIERPDFIYYVAETFDGYALWSEHAEVYRWTHGSLPIDALVFLCDAVVPSAFIRFDRTLVSMHAAALSCYGKSIALAGHSTAGKTTTLLACAQSGMGVYSDERALMRNEILHPFLRRCTVREDSAKRLLDDGVSTTLTEILRAQKPFSFAQSFGRQAIAAPARLEAIFLLDGFGPLTSIERMDSAIAVSPIARWFDADGGGLRRIALLRALLQRIPCYRLVLGSPSDAAGTIRQFCESTDASAVL